MAIELDKATIINRALARLGSAPLAGLTDESQRARSALAIYDDRIETCLALHPWRFAQKTVELVVLGDDDDKPVNGWTYAYGLPGERVSLPNKVLVDPKDPDNPLREFALEEDRLYADVRPLWVTCTFATKPGAWAPAFREAATLALAAAMAEPIAGNPTLRDRLFLEAFGPPSQDMRGGLIGKAIQIDVRSGAAGAAPLLGDDPLTAARFQ